MMATYLELILIGSYVHTFYRKYHGTHVKVKIYVCHYIFFEKLGIKHLYL